MLRIKLDHAPSDLKKAFGSIVSDSDVALVQQEGKPDLVVITLRHFKGLRETAHLLGSPENVRHLALSLEQLRAGDVVERELIDIGETDAQSPVLK